MTISDELAHLDEGARAKAQRRSLQVLFASVTFSRAGTTIGFAVAALILKSMLGNARWVGLSTVAVTVGTALSAARISAYMNKVGRRPGLFVGYAIGASGGLVAIAGAQWESVLLFLLGMALIGVGAGASNLSRYAAADLALPVAKSKAISFIVFASTIGAVIGPTLVGVTNELGDRVGLVKNAGPFGLTLVFYGIGALIVAIMLRPDPLVLADGLHKPGGPAKAGFFRSLELIFASPLARLALGSLVVSQAVMVGVMAMTPIHMEAHGHDESVIGFVLSAHVLGMFGFAPLAGWAADRFGKIPSIAIGAGTLALATTLTALATEAPNLLMFPGLYLLGLGWSFGMVAGSSLLSESISAQDRVSAQGAADLLASIVSGVAALASGLILDMTGYHILSIIGILASGVLFVGAFFRYRLNAGSPAAAT